MENCQNIIEGMNEDHYEALHMTEYVKTINGKTISIKRGSRQETQQNKEVERKTESQKNNSVSCVKEKH